MNREKEQISDIVMATKVALKTKTKIEYLPFEFENGQYFFELPEINKRLFLCLKYF